ncbi:toll/interleukin-1 receptor domain-containing protein [Lentzea sp. NPDC059081]|uniref:toll/interleukin-1 receptor domain-containing protein n=1 Tax=Lentzea sp. NPDC059081 TaxID=3346719 RepID=UPI0036A50AA0
MYDGFVSYSHAADRPLAKKLQRSLHRIGRRWYRARALRVFRDDVSLAASPDLWSSIQEALLASRTFTLLACPASAASPWVGREVALWRERKSRETFFIVLTGGELVWDDAAGDFDWERTTALPRSVAGWFAGEPLWVDLRSPERLSGAEFRAGAATLAAAVHGVAKDELISEDSRQQRQLVSVLAGLLSLALVAGGVAVWQQRVAVAQRDRAAEQARIALSRALAVEAQRLVGVDPQLAFRLALTSWSASPSVQARGALMSVVDRARYVVSVVAAGSDASSRTRPADMGTRANVAVSADGGVVAHAFGDGTVSVWDGKSRRDSGVVLPDASSALAVSGDGRVLANADGLTVKVWNVGDGSLVREVPFTGAPERVALSADGRWVAASSSKGGGSTPRFGVWEVAGGRAVVSVEGPDVPGGPVEFRGDRLFTFDGRSAAAKVTVFEPASGSWTTFGAARVWARGMAAGGSSLALLNGSALELWDVGTRTRTRAVEVGSDACCVSMSGDGERIVVGTGQGVVALFDENLVQTARLFAHPTLVRDVRMSEDGRSVVSVSENGTVVVSSPDQDNRVRVQGRGPAGVGSVAVGASGTAAVAGPGGVVVRDVRTLAEKSVQPAVRGAVHISPDGQRVSGKGVFLGDSRHLAVAGAGGVPVVEEDESRLVDSVVNQQEIAANVRGDAVATVVRSRTAAAGGTDIALWHWKDGELTEVRRMNFAADVRSFAVSDDGEQVAAADVDGRVLFDDGRRSTVFGLGPAKPSTEVAFAAGQVVQLDPGTGELVFWSTGDGSQVGRWQPAVAGPVAGLAATGDGGLLSAREDGTLAVWEADPAAWVRTLCLVVTGGLSEQERQRYVGDIDVAWPCP